MKDTKLWSENFYDNYDSYEDAKENLKDEIMDNSLYESEDEITEDDVLNQFNIDNGFEYEYVKESLLAHDKNVRPYDGGFLVLADLGLWNGRCRGGKIIGSLLSVLEECSADSSGVSWEIKDNNLVITAPHHDGTNVFTVYFVTPKGMDWAMRNYGNDLHCDRECHEHLMNTKGYVRKMFTRNWKFEWGTYL